MTYAWKRVASGKYIDLKNLSVDDLNIEDVDISINNILRFTGHYKDHSPLTVAQHSNLCLRLAQLNTNLLPIHLATLTHDFAESLIGDVVSPVKKALGKNWKKFAKPIENTFEMKFFGGLVPTEVKDIVKLFDLWSLDIERRVMWSSQYGKDKWPTIGNEDFNTKDKIELFNWAKSTPPNIKDTWIKLYGEVND